jgi:hypothetical protein
MTGLAIPESLMLVNGSVKQDKSRTLDSFDDEVWNWAGVFGIG